MYELYPPHLQQCVAAPFCSNKYVQKSRASNSATMMMMMAAQKK